MSLSENQRSEIDQLLKSHEVVLYMKGRRRMPQCGFSAKVVQILDQLIPEYHTVNVLDSPEVRENIKAYSDWPTIPQLYVKGKFIGGCDIVSELFESGELFGVLGVQPPTTKTPTLKISPSALAAFKEALAGGEGGAVRLSIDGMWRPNMDLADPKQGDVVVELGGVRFAVDRMSAAKAEGLSIDFVPGDQGGFKIDNPNEPPRVKQLAATELKARLDAGEKMFMIDVRSAEERNLACIEGSKLFDEAVKQEALALPKDITLVLYCHHGPRSQAAAQLFVQEGFRKVYNLAGGIDAWSQQVDPKTPRY